MGHQHHHGHEHQHEHSHEHHHEHGHEHGGEDGERRELLIGAGIFLAALLASGLLLPQEGWRAVLSIALYVLAYLVLGKDVLSAFLQNIRERELLDENFLMTVATLGAFVLREYPEAVGVMLFFRVGEAFEDYAVARSRERILAAEELRPETVTLLEEDCGGERIVPAGSVRPGDVFILKPGDRVPLDGTVLTGEGFADTSAITGESVPRRVLPGSVLLSGCINTTGVLTVRAEKILEESMVSRILRAVEEAEESKPAMDRFITRFARIYTPAVVGLALLTAIGLPLILRESFRPWIYTAVSFLVMSCPCALVLSVPLAYFCAIGAGSSRGILFKGGAALEALASVKNAVLDKTGTLTQGEFALQEIRPAPESGRTEEELLYLAAACERGSRHPLAAGILEAAEKRKMPLPAPELQEEIPGKGIRARLQGKMLLCGSRSLLEEAGIGIFEPQTESLSGEGSSVYLAEDGKYLGRLLVADRLKEDAREAVGKLRALGLYTVMLTGDGAAAARTAAKLVGTDEVFAELLPQDKLARVRELRTARGPVLFVGDGINDAPVLAGADVGAAMGTGADAAIRAADLVFLSNAVSSVPEALALAERTQGIARQNVIFALAVKALVLLLGVSGLYASLWLAVFADTGVAFLCILNSLRLLSVKKQIRTAPQAQS